ncbi:hypothetical protein M9H77_13554 [Catharanthus roseus]|uniref:Uncharacterized protein n=1 Tax=Catharanthus roseus TaxID=4058 RepID=A0ACC0BKG0_CATRO|nr:hypothetical protein M9H77_13554 [Catharanthus roseus]
MVRPSGRRGDDDLGPVTDRTGRVERRIVTTSSRVYDPYLHVPTIQPHIPYRSATQEPILEFIGQLRQIGAEFFYQMLGTAPQDSSCSTHGYSHAEYGVSSSVPYVPRPADRVCESDIGFESDRRVGEEKERIV